MSRNTDESKQTKNSLQYKRSGTSSFLNNKEDDGAYIKFDGQSAIDEFLRIKFGYTSSNNDYTRDIVIDLDNTIKLRDFLNRLIKYEAMQQKTFYFFSYGSNLLFKRIKKRCSSVEVVKNKKLTGYQIGFNKLSKKDGSGKANLIKTGNKNDAVWGVIHRISWNDKPKLDDAEGLGKGYELITPFLLELSIKCHAYSAIEGKYLTSTKPYNWYLQLVIEGAKENNFPEDYIDYLKSIETKIDGDECRRLKELSVIDQKYALEHHEKCK